MPVFHTYLSADAVATIEGANYFDGVAHLMTSGDVLFAKATDGSRLYEVAVSGSGVVTLPRKAQFGTGASGVAALTESGGVIGGSPNSDLPALTQTSADLTDNTGGTATTTLAAINDPGDTPADADALRDDLVANFTPRVRNAIASLAAQSDAQTVEIGKLIEAVRDIAAKVNSLKAAI